ncbi:Ribosome biogenesis protein BRX1-like [Lamellibrachia satsuma]|nr:Ribosome biogenesis protein BRX1-like [Lamellibrachia satsuma]
MWIASTPRGPSAKFLVENVHTMLELKMTGNCLKGSRPLLSFDPKFDDEPHLALLKELFIQTFSTPNYHPKSQPFIDHVFTFSVADNRIWFRNYQILEENGELAEIGPRMVLNPIRIFQGSFGGPTLYQNPHYVSPNMLRRMVRLRHGVKYMNRVQAKKAHEARHSDTTYSTDPTDEVFNTNV